MTAANTRACFGSRWITWPAPTRLAWCARSTRTGCPWPGWSPIITAVASALDYAHHRGMLHRDVKPANILLTDPDGQAQRIYLADFGVARHINDSVGPDCGETTTVGTVAYAAPEQLKAEPIDGRADQYALACTAFHLLTGVPPFVHANPGVVITQHVNEPPPSIAYLPPGFGGAGSGVRRGDGQRAVRPVWQLRGIRLPTGPAVGHRLPSQSREIPYASDLTAPARQAAATAGRQRFGAASRCPAGCPGGRRVARRRRSVRDCALRQAAQTGTPPRRRPGRWAPSPARTGRTSARPPISTTPRFPAKNRRRPPTACARRAAAPGAWRPGHGSPAKPSSRRQWCSTRSAAAGWPWRSSANQCRGRRRRSLGGVHAAAAVGQHAHRHTYQDRPQQLRGEADCDLYPHRRR